MTSGVRQYWDRVGGTYADNWHQPARAAMSQLELAFIDRNVPRRPGLSVLDVGSGSGRIAGRLLERVEVDRLVGLDIAPEMVAVCRRRFEGHPKSPEFLLCDISTEDPPVAGELDLVTAIRSVKYSPNWPDIVRKLAARLGTGGVLVLSMANHRSATRLSRGYPIDYFCTSRTELAGLVEDLGFDLLELTAFGKAPDIVYRAATRPALVRTLTAAERALDAVLGPTTLARELFVAARRR